MKVRIYGKNVISRAIYTPKLLFAYGTRFSRAYDTHFLAYNKYELPTPLPPKQWGSVRMHAKTIFGV